jgi:hypothetical protein
LGIPRLISLLFLASGLYLLGHDVASMLRHAATGPRSLEAVWTEIDSGGLGAAQKFVQHHLSADLWDPGITTLLEWPAWVLPLGAGLVIMIIDVFSQRRGHKP